MNQITITSALAKSLTMLASLSALALLAKPVMADITRYSPVDEFTDQNGQPTFTVTF